MNTASACIYCGKTDVMSKEHILPACLGTFRGDKRLRDRVCQSCNGRIGALEDQFCHTGEAGLFRRITDVHGRKRGTKVSPFERGSAGAPPIEIRFRDPAESDAFEVLWEPIPGMRALKPVRQVIVRDNETGKVHQVPLPMRGGSAGYVRRHLREEECATDLKALKVYGEMEEYRQLERMMKALGARKVRRSFRTRAPVNVSVVMRSTITDKYCRTIAKIVFHYFLREFPRFRGDESAFAPIRSFIIEGGKVRDFVEMGDDAITHDMSPGVSPSRWLHVVRVDKQYIAIRGKVSFFLGPGYTPPTWSVNIGQNPERVATPDPEGIGHQFVYLGSDAQEGYDGETEELKTFRGSLLP